MREINWSAVSGISTFVMAVAGVAALAFAVVQIHEYRDEAKIQHLEDRIKEYDSPTFVDIRRSLAAQRIDQKQEQLQKYDPDDPPDPLIDELNFCNDLGMLVSRGALDRHDVWDVFSDWLFVLYRDAQPAIDAARKEGPANFGDCTDLVDSLQPIEKAENEGSDDHPSDADIYQFYLSETKAQPDQLANRGKQPQKHSR